MLANIALKLVTTEVRMQINIKSDFIEWRNEWDALGSFAGPELKNPDNRISQILSLWQVEPLGSWRRSAKDLPKRFLKDERYGRGNRNSKRRGEHQIEYEILERDFFSVTYDRRHLLDGVNAFPLVKSTVGRTSDVEADPMILVGPTDAASILVLDMKKRTETHGARWSKTFDNPACSFQIHSACHFSRTERMMRKFLKPLAA
jgi:hypothetical protein